MYATRIRVAFAMSLSRGSSSNGLIQPQECRVERGNTQGDVLRDGAKPRVRPHVQSLVSGGSEVEGNERHGVGEWGWRMVDEQKSHPGGEPFRPELPCDERISYAGRWKASRSRKIHYVSFLGGKADARQLFICKS